MRIALSEDEKRSPRLAAFAAGFDDAQSFRGLYFSAREARYYLMGARVSRVVDDLLYLEREGIPQEQPYGEKDVP